MVHTRTQQAVQTQLAAPRTFSGLHNTQPVENRSILRTLFIPDALIKSLAQDPLAIGVYVAIARLVVAAKGAVPLAARDLASWMGSNREADRVAIMRRIIKLTADGWLCIERSVAAKHCLLPTWGRDQQGLERPWNIDAESYGRPAHVRGRRVPIDLLDDYIGRLDPQPGQARALISRYLTRPLIDITDLGIYTIGLLAEIEASPRLFHLGLANDLGVFSPITGEVLLRRATAGELTTFDSSELITVAPSIHGYRRLDRARPLLTSQGLSEDWGRSHGRSSGGSDSRSESRSEARSQEEASSISVEAHQDAPDGSLASHVSLIAWDDRDSELINQESAACEAAVQGDGGILVPVACELISQVDAYLADEVMRGHTALNPTRTIPAGEWWELVALQQQYGAFNLLIWQARAARVSVNRPLGITPAYYATCAAAAEGDSSCSVSRSTLTRKPQNEIMREGSLSENTARQFRDPEAEALLRAMGVRERQKLTQVSIELVRAWKEALEHPGIEAQFTNPLGFAVSQMQRGNRPPPVSELERWARAPQRDKHDSTNHHTPILPSSETLEREQQLETRVRALAPQDADIGLLCELAQLIESGATDEDVHRYLSGLRAGGGS